MRSYHVVVLYDSWHLSRFRDVFRCIQRGIEHAAPANHPTPWRFRKLEAERLPIGVYNQIRITSYNVCYTKLLRNVDLPQTDSKPLPDDAKTPVVASVDAQGRYLVDIGNSSKQTIGLDDLAIQVQQYLQAHPDSPVVVQGDAKVQYDAVIQLMAALKDAGVPNVGLMTQPRDK